MAGDAANAERARLIEGAGALGVPLGEAQASLLLRLLDELTRWNKAYNLTSIDDRAGMLTHHLLDSLAASPDLAGARVADIGCGHGASTIIMAQAYPESSFVGFDYHAPSIDHARNAAKDAGLSDRVSFEVARAQDFPGSDYDLVAVFDALHDMGDPVGAAAHVRNSLKGDGTWLIVEPFANDRLEDNLNPIGRIYYSASSFICTPASRSQEVGACLGAQAGEQRLREVVTKGGFKHFRRATETPFNLVLEARP